MQAPLASELCRATHRQLVHHEAAAALTDPCRSQGYSTCGQMLRSTADCSPGRLGRGVQRRAAQQRPPLEVVLDIVWGLSAEGLHNPIYYLLLLLAHHTTGRNCSAGSDTLTGQTHADPHGCCQFVSLPDHAEPIGTTGRDSRHCRMLRDHRCTCSTCCLGLARHLCGCTYNHRLATVTS